MPLNGWSSLLSLTSSLCFSTVIGRNGTEGGEETNAGLLTGTIGRGGHSVRGGRGSQGGRGGRGSRGSAGNIPVQRR